jgi:hypothetical protein
MQQFTLELPDKLAHRLIQECEKLGVSVETHVTEILEGAIGPAENLRPNRVEKGLGTLRDLLARVPSVTVLSSSNTTEPYWWVKFDIDIRSRVAWNVVQELGFVLNYISVEERLPTVFKPVSPPPYLNGGPEEFLSWVIEAKLPFLDAKYVADTLEKYLPQPLQDEQKWLIEKDN